MLGKREISKRPSGLGVNQSERIHVKVWERRSASHGGRYFFILRGNKVFPIEKIGSAQKHDDVGRAAFYVEADLNPDDEVAMVGFSNSGNPSMYCCYANELKIRKDGLHDIPIGKAAKSSIVNQFVENVNVPKWLRKQIMENILPWTR